MCRNKNPSAASPTKKVWVVRYLSTAVRNSNRYSYRHAEIKGQHSKQKLPSHRIVHKALYHTCRQAEFSITILCFAALVPAEALNAPLHTSGGATRMHTRRKVLYRVARTQQLYRAQKKEVPLGYSPKSRVLQRVGKQNTKTNRRRKLKRKKKKKKDVRDWGKWSSNPLLAFPIPHLARLLRHGCVPHGQTAPLSLCGNRLTSQKLPPS